MESDDFKFIAEQYRTEFPIWERVGQHVELRLKSILRRAGIRCTTSSRPKDLASFLRKVVKGKTPEEVSDKAGARAVLTYEDQVENAKRVICDEFDVIKEDDKTEKLAATQLDYLGVHYDVKLREADLLEDDADAVGRMCEIQLHTRAQNVWAEVSHDLVYKTRKNPPKAVERRIMRLEALVEIFDGEVTRARQDIQSEPGLIEARMLYAIEPYFVRFGGESFDEELSIDVLMFLKETLSANESAEFISLMANFVDANEPKLEMLFQTHLETQPPNPLLLQPEALLIYERLQSNVFKLADVWAHHQPISLLQSFAEEWGVALPEVA